MSRTSKITMALSLALSALSAVEAARADDGRISPDEYDDILRAMLPGLAMAGLDTGTVTSIQAILTRIADATDDHKLSLVELAETLGLILQTAGVPVEWDFGGSAA